MCKSAGIYLDSFYKGQKGREEMHFVTLLNQQELRLKQNALQLKSIQPPQWIENKTKTGQEFATREGYGNGQGSASWGDYDGDGDIDC